MQWSACRMEICKSCNKLQFKSVYNHERRQGSASLFFRFLANS